VLANQVSSAAGQAIFPASDGGQYRDPRPGEAGTPDEAAPSGAADETGVADEAGGSDATKGAGAGPVHHASPASPARMSAATAPLAATPNAPRRRSGRPSASSGPDIRLPLHRCVGEVGPQPRDRLRVLA